MNPLAAYTTSNRSATLQKPKGSKATAAAVKKVSTLDALYERIRGKRFVLGIDSGKHTGFALWDRKERRYVCIETMGIHDAIINIYRYCVQQKLLPHLHVRVEDARLRKWFGDNASAKLQGAGSIKRDCTIWEDYLTDMGVSFEMVAPIRGGTKWTEELFYKTTKWKGITSNHARDAAVMVYDL